MKKEYLLTAVICLFSLNGYCQNGDPDITFGNNGYVETDLSGGGSDFAFGIAQTHDGKLLVSGGKEAVFPDSYPAIVQYSANGNLSVFFGGDGIVSREIGTDYGFYTHIAAQSDGKVVAAGSVGPFGSRILIVNRYLPNGDLDVSFGNNGELIPFNSTNESSVFALLDNDSFLIANPVTSGSTVIQLKKYLPDGSPDASFGNNGTTMVENGGQSNEVYAIEIMDNGNILLAGNIQTNGISLTSFARFLPDGSKDPSFGNNGVAPITEFTEYTFRAMALFDDGRIALLQTSYTIDPETLLARITRYDNNGVFDDSFGTSGQGFIDPNLPSHAFKDLLIQPNQRLLLFGNFSDPLEGGGHTLVKRYHTNGGTDTNFMFTSSTQGAYFSQRLLLQDDGKLVCIGTSAWYNGPENFVVERYNNVPLNIADLEVQTISAIPNPTDGKVTLLYDVVHATGIPFSLVDVSGKRLLEGSLSGDRHEIDLSNFGTGMYFLSTPRGAVRLLKH